jgi:chorismate mutase
MAYTETETIKELEFLKTSVEKFDFKLLEVLSKRKKVTDKIGRIKAKYNLASESDGKENSLGKIKEKAIALNINPDLVMDILKIIIEYTDREHDLARQRRAERISNIE